MRVNSFEEHPKVVWLREFAVAQEECVIWPHGKDRDGYGRLTFKGKGYRAHRVVLSWKEGRDLKKGELACHSCDNPSCVNPDHLWVGSPKDNTQDMWSKGRQNGHMQGGKAVRVFDKQSATGARGMAAAGVDMHTIARFYGVSVQAVSDLVRGIYYTDWFSGDARGDRAGINPVRPISDEMVQEIMRRHEAGETQQSLEKEYGLAGGIISRIKNKKIYADVEW